MKLSEAVRERILILCKQNGITEEILIHRTDAPKDTVREVIMGHDNSISLDLMYSICSALEITMQDFLLNNLCLNEKVCVIRSS